MPASSEVKFSVAVVAPTDVADVEVSTGATESATVTAIV